MKVAEIYVDHADSTGAHILTVYAKLEPLYAVYRTPERVMVHFADDPEEDKAQRTRLVAINPIRGQINGLIDGWRASDVPDKEAKAKLFDRRVADALVVAMQGDTASAALILQATKDDLVAERTSWARFEYLLWASGAAALAILLFSGVTARWFGAIYDFSSDAVMLWRAAGAGTIGAFFSIAIGIRNRTILTDLQSRDNAADAILRIVIGAIAAALLVCLLRSDLVGLTISNAPVEVRPGGDSWIIVMIVGFIAGFMERLVPDLLDKSALSGRAPTAAAVITASTTTTAGASAAPITGDGAAGDDPDPDDPEAALDCCAADMEPDPDEETQDVELPPATGGVEAARPG